MSGLLQLSGIVVDLVHYIDRLPAPGEEVESRGMMITAGGGFNAMAAAKRLGAAVTYGGTLGTGPFAEIASDALSHEGIAATLSPRIAVDQGSCVVLVEKSAERSFVSHHGAERKVSGGHLQSLRADTYDWLLLTGYSLYVAESAAVFAPWLEHLARGPMLLFDPGPTVSDIPRERLAAVLARANWVSANAKEAFILSDLGSPASAAAQLAQGRAGAIVRVGSEGCWLSQGGAPAFHIKGFAVDAKDTNGAGDTHDGTFIAAMVSGHSAVDACIIANAAAALSTQQLGPATGPDLLTTHNFLRGRGHSLALPEARSRTEGVGRS